MTKHLLLSLLTAAILFSSGCALFRSSAAKQRAKKNAEIAADVEESFRQRWVDKRLAELTAQGVAAEAARTQAEAEFRERFSYTRAAQK